MEVKDIVTLFEDTKFDFVDFPMFIVSRNKDREKWLIIDGNSYEVEIWVTRICGVNIFKYVGIFREDWGFDPLIVKFSMIGKVDMIGYCTKLDTTENEVVYKIQNGNHRLKIELKKGSITFVSPM